MIIFCLLFICRKIVSVVLDSMFNLKGVLQLQKNCCLTLCNFKIPVELVSIWLCPTFFFLVEIIVYENHPQGSTLSTFVKNITPRRS